MCIEKKILIIMMVVLLIISFVIGWNLAERTPYCNINNKDIDYIRGTVGFGDLRFLSENMTIKELNRLYDTYYPLSKYIAVNFMSGVCE